MAKEIRGTVAAARSLWYGSLTFGGLVGAVVGGLAMERITRNRKTFAPHGAPPAPKEAP